MRRRVTISVMLPVTVDVIVEPEGGDPDDVWAVVDVLQARVDTPSARFLNEQMDESTTDELDRLARAAPDEGMRFDPGRCALVADAVTASLDATTRQSPRKRSPPSKRRR